MTYSCHKIKFCKKVVMLIAVFFSLALISHADPLSSAMKDWHASGIAGKLSVSENGYIINEVKIVLVDQKVRDKQCRTMVHDMDGKELNQDELTDGKYVFVKGGGLQDYNGEEIIVAKEIYILPREMNRAKLEKAGLYKTTPEPW